MRVGGYNIPVFAPAALVVRPFAFRAKFRAHIATFAQALRTRSHREARKRMGGVFNV